jgi:cystathionine beta-lyase family protein involved in aluminum resistance
MLQGMFYAPRTVAGAVKGAILCSAVFEKLGYGVCPTPEAYRSDIVQAVKLRDPEAVSAFCEGIQAAAPIDSFVTPVPGEMAGYDHDIIMAAGSFVQGSTMELSADSPMREPYIAYFQGGISYEHSKFGVMNAVQSMLHKDLIDLDKL